MSSKLQIKTLDIQFGEHYDAHSMRLLMNHVADLTRLNQRLIQLLRGGEAGQVLKKLTHEDLDGLWGEGGGVGPTLRVGHGPPADSAGVVGDVYIDLDNGNVYELE